MPEKPRHGWPGRLGVGVRFRNIQKLTMALAALGTEFETTLDRLPGTSETGGPKEGSHE